MINRRIVFAYQFMTLGGVEVVLKNRLLGLAREGFECRLLFLEEYGGWPLFADCADQVMISNRREEVETFLADFDPAWVVSIDTPQIFPWVRQSIPAAGMVYEVHSNYALTLSDLLNPETLLGVSGVIVPSASQGLVVRALAPHPPAVKVVANGLSELFLQPPAMEPATEPPLILWVGRLDPVKNWRAFVEIADLLGRQKDVQFCMVGGEKSSTDDQQALRDLLAASGLGDSFTWLPSVPHAEMPALFQRAGHSGGCLVSTSWAESFGLVVLEAMACGCPVVVPEVIGLSDLVEHGVTGLWYQSGVNEDAAEKILQLLAEDASRRRLIQAAGIRARQFTMDGSIAALVATLQSWGKVPPTAEPAGNGDQLLVAHRRQLALLHSGMRAYCAQASDYVRLIRQCDQVILSQQTELQAGQARLREISDQLDECLTREARLQEHSNELAEQLTVLQESTGWSIAQLDECLTREARLQEQSNELAEQLTVLQESMGWSIAQWLTRLLERTGLTRYCKRLRKRWGKL